MERKSFFVSPRIERAVLIALRCAIGVVFVWASVDKILHPEQFARAVANYHILPPVLVNLFALILPWVELICGLCLILGQWQRAASLVLACVIVMFIAAVGVSMWRGLDIHCGCFNASSGRKIGGTLLIEDLALLAATVLLLSRSRDSLGLSGFLGRYER